MERGPLLFSEAPWLDYQALFRLEAWQSYVYVSRIVPAWFPNAHLVFLNGGSVAVSLDGREVLGGGL